MGGAHFTVRTTASLPVGRLFALLASSSRLGHARIIAWGIADYTTLVCDRRDVAVAMVRYNLGKTHHRWFGPSQLDENPLTWLKVVDGLVGDVRRALRCIQEDVVWKGLIPYLPG